jgi:hypothetical protein
VGVLKLSWEITRKDKKELHAAFDAGPEFERKRWMVHTQKEVNV